MLNVKNLKYLNLSYRFNQLLPDPPKFPFPNHQPLFSIKLIDMGKA